MKLIPPLTLCLFAASVNAEPIFPNSVVSNDLEFITTADENTFYCLNYFGTGRREMPDKRKDVLFADGVHDFEAWFSDGNTVGIWVHPDIGDYAAAQLAAQKLTGPLGRLPHFMRASLSHVVVHDGDETAFAEDLGRFFVVYTDNMDDRISTHDLEETVFHEAVHATLDISHAGSAKWQKAQAEDADFVTRYAAQNPNGEDFAETALFAYTYFQHPDRLPAQVVADLRAVVPHRLAYLSRVFGAGIAMQRPVAGLEACEN